MFFEKSIVEWLGEGLSVDHDDGCRMFAVVDASKGVVGDGSDIFIATASIRDNFAIDG